jgi:hypothetical protein
MVAGGAVEDERSREAVFERRHGLPALRTDQAGSL